MNVAVDWDVEHLRLAVRAAGVALWSWNVDTNQLALDNAGLALWGTFAATRAIVGPYEIDFRIMLENEVRWISARGQGDDLNIADKIMFGVFLDVTARASLLGRRLLSSGPSVEARP